MSNTTGKHAARRPQRNHGIWIVVLVGAMTLGTSASAAKGAKACSGTAKALLSSCRGEGLDAQGKATAVCLNAAEATQPACFAAAKAERAEQAEECSDQYDARLALCESLGEARYDPPFDPASFEDDFENPSVSNPYLPLEIGNSWDFSNGDETVEVEVKSDTKRIDGVTCVVVRDRVRVDGDLVEDTDDWFALALNGDVWYCGEEAKDYESFAGDDPETPELVSIDGSFKAGRDGDKPGLLVAAAPVVGQAFRQEFSVGNAEDVVEVLSIAYVFGNDPALDALVPQALADHLCGAGCVVTRDTSPLSPDAVELKYYAPGIGVFLETDVAAGEVTRLVDCNVDPRCATLPQP